MSEIEEAKLTHSTDEFDLDSILGGDCIFSIPYFQRAYKWGKKELNEFLDDIEQIVGKEKDVHFLGALILYSKTTPAGRSKTLEVVDGQQRLTTLMLILAALVEQFCILEKYDDADALFQRYLFLGRKPKEISNLKLHPSKEDRNQFNNILLNLLKEEKFNKVLEDPKLMLLQPTGPEVGKLTEQYANIKRYLEKKRKTLGFDGLDMVYQSVIKRFTCVQIILKDPTACSRIFERLNYRGVKVNIGDLVRNEIFSKVAEMPQSNIESVYSIHWEPFYQKFKSPEIFESYFFPFGIIKKPSLNKNEIFNYLRNEWSKIGDPEKIIEDLKRYQDVFLYLEKKSTSLEIPEKTKKNLTNLVASRIPSSLYPFIILLIYHVQQNKIDDTQASKILGLIDSFLTRRAICGIEPTGLHAVFRDLWEKVGAHPTEEKVKNQIKSYRTVSWPNDEEFKSAIMSRPVYGSGITSYFIIEYDKSLGGDVPNDKPTIEHILPKSYEPTHWGKLFTKEEHAKLANTLANLVPLSSTQNNKIEQKAYDQKRIFFANDSMYKTPRYVATKYKSWDKTAIEERGSELISFATRRWPSS